MWTKQSLQEAMREKMRDYRFIIVSNREPYIHEHSGKRIKCIKAISGLVIALDPVIQASGGVWVACGSGDADRDVVDKHNKIQVPPEDPSYTLKRVWLSKEEESGYYYGYANCALWPLSHISYEKPTFNAADWEYYKAVNMRFADNVLEEAAGGKCFIWLQDYHLTLAAKYIREKNPKAIISLFWHIPWPNPEVFRICPQKREVLEGLLANDLLGFHIRYHCHNFLATVENELEAKVDWVDLSITHRGHKTLVRPFPISVDYHGISKQAHSKEVDEALRSLPETIDPPYEILALGIDRVDYTKGIIERIRAIDRFLEKYPQYQGKFVFLQFGALSRIHIKSYKQLIDNVQALAEEVNWKYRKGYWYPVVVKNIRLDYASHLALYRAGDLCLVSSLHDGMNLVAKEFIAANLERRGVLILSQFTGASREFAKQAILVNPYDTEGFADAIKYAIELSDKKKQERMRKMQKILEENNIYRWAGKFISNLLNLE